MAKKSDNSYLSTSSTHIYIMSLIHLLQHRPDWVKVAALRRPMAGGTRLSLTLRGASRGRSPAGRECRDRARRTSIKI
ncbi:hypothetical protein HZ326_23639 [Fusarium oxysporum f. sp. albedinis]|nr:hypothetical protein HZ326_23639 [Fusarium oxysporum f. sp. albedinis]